MLSTVREYERHVYIVASRSRTLYPWHDEPPAGSHVGASERHLRRLQQGLLLYPPGLFRALQRPDCGYPA